MKVSQVDTLAPPLISVIIPTHFRTERLRHLLVTLEKQTLEPNKFEVIVVTSPLDPSLAFLKEFKSSFALKVFTTTEDPEMGRNVSLKRNKGAGQAQGSWLAFTDDDCLPSPLWLESCLKYFADPNIHGVEGLTITNKNESHTLTWKGLQRLARPGTYQTCNIVYRKETFNDLGGFDAKQFPWYLEDTDLAWTFLNHNKKIAFNDKAIVEHPVGAPAPWRLLHEARNAGLKVILYLKHNDLYKTKKMQVLRGPHFLYLILALLILISLFLLRIEVTGILSLLYLCLFLTHLVKTFWGLQFTMTELLSTAYGLFLYPYFALFSLVKHSIKRKIDVLSFFRMLFAF